MTSTAAPKIEHRLSRTAAGHTCPLCGTAFRAGPGILPFLAGTESVVCRGTSCASDDAVITRPCNASVFEFTALSARAVAAVRETPDTLDVGERLRRAGLDHTLSAEDQALLQFAAIDLQFCEADGTRIRSWEPTLVIETCGEAAAELLLSGCGEIL